MRLRPGSGEAQGQQLSHAILERRHAARAEARRGFLHTCDRMTMTQADLDGGRLIMVIGIAPVKPAEFIILESGSGAEDPK